MTTDIPTHRAAMFQVDQVRCSSRVGARSLFHSGECETSSCSSTKSRCSFAVSEMATACVVIFVTRAFCPCVRLQHGQDARGTGCWSRHRTRSALQELPFTRTSNILIVLDNHFPAR